MPNAIVGTFAQCAHALPTVSRKLYRYANIDSMDRSVRATIALLAFLLLSACGAVAYPATSRTGGAPEVPTEKQSPCPMRPERLPAPGELRPISAVLDPAQPLLIDGYLADLDTWAEHARFPVYVPQDGNLPPPQLWVLHRGLGPQHAGVRYACQLAVTYTQWPSGSDAASEYVKEARQWKAGYATTIAGHPAWVRAPSAHTLDSRMSSISVTIGSLEVSMLAIMPMDRLLADAASLHPVVGSA
jgi:hypothetical protein